MRDEIKARDSPSNENNEESQNQTMYIRKNPTGRAHTNLLLNHSPLRALSKANKILQ
jgi:hypothetical protein